MRFSTILPLLALAAGLVEAQAKGKGNGGQGQGKGNQAAAAQAAAAKGKGNQNQQQQQQAAAAQAAAAKGKNNQNQNKNNNNQNKNNQNKNNNNNGNNLALDPNNVQKNSANDGLADAEPGQAASLTDNANFINFCTGQTLTNGLQVKQGSCNGIPMGQIPAQNKMVSAVIVNPKNNDDVAENTPINFQVQIANLQAGVFTNPDNTYYAAPQQVKGGTVVGHTHITVQDLGQNANAATPPDAAEFAFFKGINDAGNGKGLLAANLAQGLPAGNYRVCSMTSASNHQPVLMPVAQRGPQDDCTRFTVSANGGGNNNNNNQNKNKGKGNGKGNANQNANAAQQKGQGAQQKGQGAQAAQQKGQGAQAAQQKGQGAQAAQQKGQGAQAAQQKGQGAQAAAQKGQGAQAAAQKGQGAQAAQKGQGAQAQKAGARFGRLARFAEREYIA